MDEYYTYKIWDKVLMKYVENGNYDRASYDCFPEKSVKQIAGRICGKGNYEIHRFNLFNKVVIS